MGAEKRAELRHLCETLFAGRDHIGLHRESVIELLDIADDRDRLAALNRVLAERVAAQSELLSRRAEVGG